MVLICTDINNLLILKDKILNIKEISILLNKCKWTKDDIDNTDSELKAWKQENMK